MPGCGGLHSAARPAWLAANGQRAHSAPRMRDAVFHRQYLRSGPGRFIRWRGLRQHLSSGRRSHREAVPLLSSWILQRDLLGGTARWTDGARYRGLRRRRTRNRRGNGDSAAGDFHGDDAAFADLAGIEGDRKMTQRGFGSGDAALVCSRFFSIALVLAGALARPIPAASLAENIEHLIASSQPAKAAFWGIQIVDLQNGKTIYEQNANRVFVPAPNTKLFPTPLALIRLGPDFTFQTRVLADGPPDDQGFLAGDLRLVGGGDPNLSGRAIPYRMRSP